jgi:hypothetical protein
MDFMSAERSRDQSDVLYSILPRKSYFFLREEPCSKIMVLVLVFVTAKKSDLHFRYISRILA